MLAAVDRERWKTVAGVHITRARWLCVAVLEGEAALEALEAPVPEWAQQTQIVHSSALTPQTILRYENEAKTWQKR